MANVLYPKFKEACLGSGGTLPGGDVRVILVDLADYTYNATHEFLTSVVAGARVAVSPSLGSKVITNGIFSAGNTTFTAVTGDQSEALVLYLHTGTDGTSRLIAFLDTGITGMPVTPNGGDINVNWDTGANKIFAL
jgi:hypothetical protein